MVKLARQKLNDERTSFEVGDAEEITLGEEYDLITSNVTFHWLGDFKSIEELHLANAREDAIDADADEVGVVAVGADPAIDLVLVGKVD